MVSHNLQQRGAAEAGDVKFAVEQRMGATVMLLQEVCTWPGGQGVLTGCELYTDTDLDTAVATPRDFACDVREKILSKRYTFVVLFGTVWGSVHLPCHGDVSQDDLWSMLKEMDDVVINLRRRHRTPRIVIGSDLNVSLAPSLEGFIGSRIHSNANGAPSGWRGVVTEWIHSFRLRALCAHLINAFLSHMWNGITIPVGRTETLTRAASFSWITCLSLSMSMVRPVWCGVAII